MDQYPGGAAGRAAEIDEGAGRSARDLADDLEEADLALPDLVAGLAARTDPVALAAWAMDRAEAPQLRPWDS